MNSGSDKQPIAKAITKFKRFGYAEPSVSPGVEMTDCAEILNS
jgi:hypothetical protein